MNRRDFLAAAPVAVTPLILGAARKSGSGRPVLGQGEHAYEVVTHNFGTLPAGLEYQTTHNVALDQEGLVYVTNQGIGKTIDTVFVFEPAGKFVRSFGRAFHGGGHGLDIRTEGREQFCYLTNTSVASPKVAKTTLKGEIVWTKDRPEADAYADPKKPYKPTNVAFRPDGGFTVADGYGSNYLLHYGPDGKLNSVTGGTGKDPGQFRTPHGLWADLRDPGNPTLVVCDRANARLQTLLLDGTPLGQSALGDVLFPATIDTRESLMVVADLHARLSLFAPGGKLVTHLGDDPAWRTRVLADNNRLRTQPKEWADGKFVHPHDAAFDAAGNIYVTEWVVGGRVSVLKKVG